MNPIDSYRDPALDNLVEPPLPLPSSNRKPSRHARQTSTATRDMFPPPNLPHAPAPPGVPPIAYPGTNQEGQGIQRSFSQRARGRPFADEAFANDSLADASQEQPVERQSRARHVSAQEPLYYPPPDPKQTSRRQQIIQDNIKSAAESVRSPRDDHLPQNVATKNIYDDQENQVPGMTRAPTLKTAAQPVDERDWAPDRSPLQKLEVTLGDISKEAKRAKVQEAEMLHREKTRSQKQPERYATEMNRQRPQPATIEDAGLVRGLSNTHKDRLQHSTVIDAKKPDATRLSGDTRGFNYQSAALPTRSVTITRRGNRNSSAQPMLQSQRAASTSYGAPQPQPIPSTSQARSVSATQPMSRATGTDPLPLATSQQPRPRQIYNPERIPTAQERNASHRAALNQLEGSGTGSRSRSDPSRPRDVSGPRVHEASDPSLYAAGAISGVPDSTRMRVADTSQQAPRTLTPQGQTIPTGLGLQGSPGVRSVDSPAPVENLNVLGQRQKRRSSVSFKDPYERRRPVDEWKAAETARLLNDDFSLEQKADPNRNRAWWEDDPNSKRTSSRSRPNAAPERTGTDDRTAEFNPKLFLKCGPLLRYTGIKRTVGDGGKEYWRGTAMVVTLDSQSSYDKPPSLRIFAQPKILYKPPVHVPNDNDDDETHPEIDPLAGSIKMSRIGRALYVKPARAVRPGQDLSRVETDDGLYESTPPIHTADEHSTSVTPVTSRLSEANGEHYGRYKEIKGVRLYADPDRDVTFWLFKLEIQLGPQQQHIGYRINNGAASGFWVPAEGQTMNIMFHSCNGFSMSVKTDEFSGPDPLWRDVLSAHQSRPFHVMIGGGDQIYNDKAMRDTQQFSAWTLNKNPHYKHTAPLTNEMKEELEWFYLENYSEWFSQGLFAMAGSQIPMVNMWDDHDIIDGFGSYPHPFMMSPVFSGIGNIAHKYYMLFQQHSVDAMTTTDEPSWVLGYKPGPYIKHVSRSILLDLGKTVAFLALDCRTERMKNQVLSVDTCDIALERCRKEIIEGQTRHLIVLLGVPIAYPRMNWLENVLTSRAMDPIKALGRYGVIKGGLLNRFDGGVEVLDDLDDHWTAHHHKEERNEFIKELQDLAAERSVRITILGGDVHLAAIGQFYSNPKLKIPKDRDHRYMPNVVSSAIVNTPPPELLADTLNKRNKVHHLDQYTDESMIPMFTHDVDMKKRNNKHLLPRRNWCSITAYLPGKTPPSSRDSSPTRSMSDMPDDEGRPQPKRRFSLSRDDVNPRTLFRRLSSRNAPPNAYREDYGDDRRAASFDETRPGRSGPSSWTEKIGIQRRTASETREPTTNGFNTSNGDTSGRQPPPFRPGFHRRPTNLSEKAAKKGNVPAIDAEGNEFDVNGHVNLDGGLDIVLNCEIDRKDPRGSTEPYRLLVPALWYDGSSDREKLDATEGVQRKPTLMNKLGFGGRGQKPAQNQGAENGQDMSETESYAGSEDGAEEKPKKMFGLFPSLRRKRPDYEDDAGHDRELPDHYGAAAGVVPGADDYHSDRPISSHQQATTTTPGYTPPRMSHQAGPGAYDLPPGMHQPPPQPTQAAFNQPPGQSRELGGTIPQRTSSTKGNVLRKNSLKRQGTNEPNPYLTQVLDPRVDGQPPQSSTSKTASGQPRAVNKSAGPIPALGATTAGAYAQPPPQSRSQYPPEPISPNTARRLSYTIGSHRSGSTRKPISSQDSGTLYDADSAYLSTQQRQQGPATRNISAPISNSMTGPPSSYPAPGRASDDLQRSNSASRPWMSKQEQILGIGTDHDSFSGNPQQRSLRGNGILGRLGLGRSASSADRVPQFLQKHQRPMSGSADQVGQMSSGQGQNEFGAPQRTLSQGYSGIEAYREKPKRGLSLRDRARNLIDRVEGKNRHDDDDDDDHSYSSEGSYDSQGNPLPDQHKDNPANYARGPLQSHPPSTTHPYTQSQPPPQPQHQHQHPHTQHAQHRSFQPSAQANTTSSRGPGPINNNNNNDDYYSDDSGSFISNSSDRPQKPLGRFSEKLRAGMARMGSSSRRDAPASSDRHAAATGPGVPAGTAAGSGGKYY